MSIWDLFSLVGGLALFLYGMRIMGEGLEKAAGKRLKRLLETVTQNRFTAVLAGFLITALIQSSSATTVMVVGFVNAGLMQLTQAVGVIMGANVGTTVTSLILSIKLDFGMIFTAIGFLMMIMPKKLGTLRSFGMVFFGLGVLFVGMETMSGAMVPLRTWDGFRNMIAGVSNPIAGVLVGAGITAVIQSSSASVGILQSMVGEGVIGLSAGMYILFGQNIGTCITALISSTGTSVAARRAAIVHLLFNVIGTVIFILIVSLLPFAQWIEALSPDNLRLQVAFIHIAFNLTTTAMLLPVQGLLERAAIKLVQGKDPEREAMKLQYFDQRLLKTPPVAVAQLFQEVKRMGAIAQTNFQHAMKCFTEWDDKLAVEITGNEEVLDYLNEEITTSLVEVKSLDLAEPEARLIGSLFHVVNDMERIGDHSLNILEAGKKKHEDGVKFSSKAVAELDELSGMVSAQLEESLLIMSEQSDEQGRIASVKKTEADIDKLVDALRDHHVDRLKNKKCSATNGMIYLDMLTNLERVADHAENIATSVDHVTPVAKWQS